MTDKQRIEILESLGFVKNEDGNWFEYTSQITLIEDQILSMSEDDFIEETNFIEYVLSK